MFLSATAIDILVQMSEAVAYLDPQAREPALVFVRLVSAFSFSQLTLDQLRQLACHFAARHGLRTKVRLACSPGTESRVEIFVSSHICSFSFVRPLFVDFSVGTKQFGEVSGVVKALLQEISLVG